MATAHKHRMRSSLRDRNWTYCVAAHPLACANDVGRCHGGIVHIDVCACGATRASESNNGQIRYGAWKKLP